MLGLKPTLTPLEQKHQTERVKIFGGGFFIAL